MKSFLNMFNDVMYNSRNTAPRGERILEVENAHYDLKPYERFMNFPNRNLSIDYIKKEFKWYLKGDPKDVSIAEHAKIWGGLISEDGILNSNYGVYVFERGGFNFVISELSRDRDSRRAVIPIYSMEHMKQGIKDVPCTCTLSFRIREDQLNMTAHMRSADLVFGWGNDIPMFSFFQEMVQVWLNDMGPPRVELGTLHMMADSLHIYERHWEMAYDILSTGDYIPETFGDIDIIVPRMSSAHEVMQLIGLRCESVDSAPQNHLFTHWLLS